MRKILAVAAAVSVVALMGACGSGEPAPSETDRQVAVTDAWARSPMSDTAAVYFVVTNEGAEADRLIEAVADVEGTVSIHETTMEGGVAEMQPVDGVDILAGETVTFEPGGYHVMIEEMTAPLEVGSTISVTLVFDLAGEIVVDAEVREFVEEEGM